MRVAFSTFAGKHEGSNICTSEDNIKMDLRMEGCVTRITISGGVL
jgi:hypothetical protein